MEESKLQLFLLHKNSNLCQTYHFLLLLLFPIWKNGFL